MDLRHGIPVTPPSDQLSSPSMISRGVESQPTYPTLALVNLICYKSLVAMSSYLRVMGVYIALWWQSNVILSGRPCPCALVPHPFPDGDRQQMNRYFCRLVRNKNGKGSVGRECDKKKSVQGVVHNDGAQ